MADDPKDLDFDELHKAVNALMDKAQKGGKPKAAPAKVKDEPADTPKTTNDDAKPQQAVGTTVDDKDDDNKVTVSIRSNPPTIAQHNASHGRAMDVVGPRSQPQITPPSAAAKREGVALQPTQEVKPEPVAPVIKPDHEDPLLKDDEDSNDLNEALATLDTEATAKPVSGQTMTHQKSEWPDPLDLNLEQDDKSAIAEGDSSDSEKPMSAKENQRVPEEPAEEPDQEEAPTIEPKPETDGAEPDQDEQSTETDEPVSGSPFVTTKVEKRPLGAYTNTVATESTMPEPEQTEIADKPNETEDTPVTPQADATTDQEEVGNPVSMQAQPAELSPAVVAVESAEPEFNQEPPKADDVAASEDLRAMAIPQQYKEPEQASNDSQRPVFDTKEYHPAIEAHSSAHHGSALGAWAMALVLLGLLVGVLGAAYYFITGSLDFSALFSF